MRHLNLKFVISMAGALLVLIAGGGLLHGFNVGRSARVYLARGNEAYASKDLRTAIKFYQDYLRQYPDDNEQRAKQALISAEITQGRDMQPGDVFVAYKLLEQALRQDELRQRADLRRKLVDVEVMRGMFNEARKNINLLRAQQKSDAELEFLYARCSFAANYYDDAIATLEPLVGFDSVTKSFDAKKATAPDNIDAYVLLGLILREQKQMAQVADSAINQMVANNAKSSKAYMQRSAYLVRYNFDGTPAERRARLNVAKEDLRQALALDPDSIDVLIQNSVLATLDKDYASARKHLEHALKISAEDERVYLRLAALMFAQKDPKAAIEYVKKGLEKIPRNLELLWALHEFQLQKGDIPGAQATIKQMEEAHMMKERVNLAKARIPMVEQNWVEAARQLEAVRPTLGPMGPDEARTQQYNYAQLALATDISLGQCYGMLRQPDRQLEAYARALQMDPRHVEALRGKAAALAALGRFEESLDAYQKGLAPVIGSEAFAADKDLLTSYHHVIAALVRRNPERKYLVVLEGNVRRQLENVGAGSVDSILFKINDLLRDKKYDEAAGVLKTVIEKNPKELQLRLALVTVLTEQKGPDAALAQLDVDERETGDSVEIRKARGELLLRKGDPDIKRQLAPLEKGAEKFALDDQVELWTRLGMMYYRLGQLSREDVRRCWQRAIELNPGNATVMEWLFELARESNDNVAMLKARDDIEKAFGRNSSQWNYAEATRLVAQARERGPKSDMASLDAALELTERAAKQRPDWHMLVRLQGEIKELKDNIDGAVQDYQRSLDLGPANPSTVRRLVAIQITRGQINEARKVLQRLGGQLDGMEREKALTEALAGQPEKALPAIIRAVPDDSTEPMDFVWKGQLLLRINQLDKAEAAFRQAVKLGPQLPQTWLALVDFLVTKAGKPDDAERAIRDAENELTDDQAPLVLGQCYALLGSQEQAEHFYLMALSARPDNAAVQRAVAAYYLATQQGNKAFANLKAMVEAAPRTSRDDLPHLMWARRELAVLIANTASYPKFQFAVHLVEENATSGTLAPADSVLLARLYNSRRDAASLRLAQKLIEDVRQQRPLEYEERVLLAEIYFKTKQWEKSRSELVDLASEQPRDARVIVALASSLLTHQDTEEAAPWVRKLELLQPKGEDTVRLSARLAAQRNRMKDAADIINSVLPKDVTPQDAGRVLAAASLLEEYKVLPAAEAKYRKVAEMGPGGKVALARFLARAGRTDETFEILSKDVVAASPSQACQIAFLALRKARQLGQPMAPQHRDACLAWFNKAGAAAGGADIEVLTEKVNFLEMIGRIDDAINLATQLVASKDVPDVVRAQVANNLAFLISMDGKNLENARKLIDFSIEQLGPMPELLDTRAMVSMAEGKTDDAIRDLTDATEFGGDAQSLFHLALAYQKATDRPSAGQAIRRARVEGLQRDSLTAVEGQKLDALDKWLES